MIEAGADVNAKDPSGSTPLHQAIVYGIQERKPEIAEVLVAASAEVDAKDGQGNTPLSLGREGLKEARNDHFSNPKRTDRQVATAETLIRLLEDAGAKDDGKTPLQQAVAAGRLDEVKRLIASGADVNARANVGFLDNMTPLMGAAGSGHVEIVQLLFEEGADVHVADPEGTFGGETALHIAAKRGHRQVVELLLEAKADINAVTGKEHVDGRKTPLDYAKAPEVKVLLLQNGGKTAIDVIGKSQSTKKPWPSANSSKDIRQKHGKDTIHETCHKNVDCKHCCLPAVLRVRI